MQPLFQPFRALGYISDDIPFAVQRRGKETFVTVSVGKAWQVSLCLNLLSRFTTESLSSSRPAFGSVGVLFLQAWSAASGPSGARIDSLTVAEVATSPDSNLLLLMLQFEHNIKALASKGDLTFAAVKSDIVVCQRVHRWLTVCALVLCNACKYSQVHASMTHA